MSKKRDIYNEMDSEDPFAEDYSAYYGEEVPEPEEEMPEAVDGGAFIDDEAEEDPYADYPYPEDGPYDYLDPYYDPYQREWAAMREAANERLGRHKRGGRYADSDSDDSVTSSSSDSESPSPSDSSSEEESTDSSSEERVTRRKPKKTFRAKAKAKKGKQNTRRKKK